MGSITRIARRRLVGLIEVFLAQEPTSVVVIFLCIRVERAFRYDAEGFGVHIPLLGHIAQLIIGIHSHGVSHRGVGQFVLCVEVSFFGHIPEVIVGRFLGRIPATDLHQLALVVIIADGSLAASKVVFIMDFGIIIVVVSALPLGIKELHNQDMSVLVHLALQRRILPAGVDRRLTLPVEQLFSGAMIPLIIGILDLCIAELAPGQFAVLVVIGLSDLVITVVILVANCAIARGKNLELTVGILVFALDKPSAIIPGIAQGREATGSVHRHIIVVQICFRFDLAIRVICAGNPGIPRTDVGTVQLIVQVDHTGHIEVVIIGELGHSITVFENGGLVGNVQIGSPPDFTLIAVLITDSGITGRDHGVQAFRVQIRFGHTAVLIVIGIDNGRITELHLNGLERSIQIIDPNQVAAIVIDTAGRRGTRNQRRNALVFVQVLLEDDMTILIILALPDAEAFRHAGQIITLIQVANLQHVVSRVILIGNARIPATRRHAFHRAVKVGSLGHTTTLIIGILNSSVTFFDDRYFAVQIPDGTDTIVSPVIFIHDPVVTVSHLGRLIISIIPGLLNTIPVCVILIGHRTIGVLLKNGFFVIAIESFAGEVAMRIPGLDFPGIAGCLGNEIAITVRVFFRQETTRKIIHTSLHRIALRGNNGLFVCSGECFCQDIPEIVISVSNSGIVAPQLVRSTGLIEIALAEEAILIVVLTLDLCGSLSHICNRSVGSVINLTDRVAVEVIFAFKESITLGAFCRSTRLIEIALRQHMTICIPGVSDLVISIGYPRGLVIGSKVSNADIVAICVGLRLFHGITERGIHRIAISIQIRNGGLVAIISDDHHGITVTHDHCRTVSVIIGLFRDTALGINLALKPCITHRSRNHRRAVLVKVRTPQQIAIGIVLYLVGSIAQRQHGRVALTIQVIYPGRDGGHRIIGNPPRGIATAQNDRLSVRAKRCLIDHVMCVVILAFHAGTAAHQRRFILRIEVGNTGDVALCIVFIFHRGVSRAVGHCGTVLVIILFARMMPRKVIGVNLYRIGSIRCDEIAVRAKCRLPQKITLAAVLTQHRGNTRARFERRSVYIVVAS